MFSLFKKIIRSKKRMDTLEPNVPKSFIKLPIKYKPWIEALIGNQKKLLNMTGFVSSDRAGGLKKCEELLKVLSEAEECDNTPVIPIPNIDLDKAQHIDIVSHGELLHTFNVKRGK